MSDRDLLRCTTALLDQGNTVDRLSRSVTAAALIGVLAIPALGRWQPWTLVAYLTVVTLLGAVEVYLSIRVGFDRTLFGQQATLEPETDFAQLDAALMSLGVITPSKACRPIKNRVAGARRLLHFQIAALAAQVAAVIIGACIVLALG